MSKELSGRSTSNSICMYSDKYAGMVIQQDNGEIEVYKIQRPSPKKEKQLEKMAKRLGIYERDPSILNRSLLLFLIVITIISRIMYENMLMIPEAETIALTKYGFFIISNYMTHILFFVGLAHEILITLSKKIKTNVSIRKFHAAEHKVINTYKNDLPLTIENVRKASRTSYGCGSIKNIVLLYFLLLISILPIDNIIGLLLVLIFIMPSVTNTVMSAQNPVANVILLPPREIGKLCQKHFFTEEPTDKELEIAIIATDTAIGDDVKPNVKLVNSENII